MSFNKFKSDSYCVGGRHKSATKNIHGDITSKGSKVLFGYCSICNRNKSMNVSDNTIQAEGFGDFCKKLGKKGVNVSKKMAKNVLSIPRRDLDLTAKIAEAAAAPNSKQALLPLPELLTFYNTAKVLYLGKFDYFIQCIWIRKQIEYTHLHH